MSEMLNQIFGELAPNGCNATDDTGDTRTAILPKEIAELTDVLDDTEREILRLRFGLDRGEPRTITEVGTEMGIESDDVALYERMALSKLRSSF